MKLTLITTLLLLAIACSGQYYDKKLHFVAGGLVAASLNPYIKNNKKAFWYSIAAGAAAGIGKEAYDKYSGKGNVEFMDFVATTAGAVVVSGIAAIIRKKRSKNNIYRRTLN